MLLVEAAARLIHDAGREDMRIGERERIIASVGLRETQTGKWLHDRVECTSIRRDVVNAVETIRFIEIMIDSQRGHILTRLSRNRSRVRRDATVRRVDGGGHAD